MWTLVCVAWRRSYRRSFRKLVEQRRYQTNIFKPAYIKDKRAPDLQPVRRMIGERIGGEMSGAEREAQSEFELTDQVDV